LEYADPRLDTYGHIDARLRYVLKGMSNVDPAATRVKAMPIQVLHHLQSVIHGKDDLIKRSLKLGHVSMSTRPCAWLTSERGAVNSWFPFIDGVSLPTTSR
jgi:hypothetical protein